MKVTTVLIYGKEIQAVILKTQRSADNYKAKNPSSILIHAKAGCYIYSK